MYYIFDGFILYKFIVILCVCYCCLNTFMILISRSYLVSFVVSPPLLNCNPVALKVNSGHYHFTLLEDLALDLVFLLKLVSAVEGPLVFDGVEVFDAVVGVLVWLDSSRK